LEKKLISNLFLVSTSLVRESLKIIAPDRYRTVDLLEVIGDRDFSKVWTCSWNLDLIY